MIHYVQGDATQPVGDGVKVITHICNDEGKWGKGFVLALSKRWKKPEQEYRDWFRQKRQLTLGDVQFVEAELGITVANLIGQHGVTNAADGKPPIRYQAVAEGLNRVAEFALQKNASVHMPRIGCGLAGGNWNEIEPIVVRSLSERGIEVTVYDLP